MKALVTGFDAFAGLPFNPSEEVLKGLKRYPPNESFDSIEFSILPTSYAGVDDWLERYLDCIPDLDLILMLGLSLSTDTLKLERFALNVIDCAVPDNLGETRMGRAIAEDGPRAYRTSVDVERIGERLTLAGIPYCVSNNAGEYVCNYIYYRVLRRLEERGSPARALFVHMPWAYRMTKPEHFDLSQRDRHLAATRRLLLECRIYMDELEGQSGSEEARVFG
jgi:pyroglutamyl-peptidase